MHGIGININPIIFQLGLFRISWYSLAIMLAVVAALLISLRRAAGKGIAGEEIYSLTLFVLLAGLIGARLFHVIDWWDYYSRHPLDIFQIQLGGLAIWGALAGGGLAILVYAWIRKLPLGRLVDTLIPGLLVAQIIGRFGCIVNGDAYGGVTSLPWGFIYINPGALIPPGLFGVPTHPYPVYEMIWNGLVLLAVLSMEKHFKKDGLLFLSYLALYSIGRFILTFVREENITWWGLQQAQVISLVVLILSLLAMLLLVKRKRAKQPEGDHAADT